MCRVLLTFACLMILAGEASASNGLGVSLTLCSSKNGCPSATPTPAPTASGTPRPTASPTPSGGLQPIGNPPLPPGTSHWVITMDDEFNVNGINAGVFNGGGGGWSNFCPDAFDGLGYGATCPAQYYGTLGSAPYANLASGYGAQVMGGIENSATNYYWAVLQTAGKFVQRYGYWEIDAQEPHDNSGEGNGAHPDIWLSVPCRTQFGGGSTCVDELDIAEGYMSTSACARDTQFMSIFDAGNAVTGSNPTPKSSVGDLSAGFHAYGAQWAPPGANGNTGSQGSWQTFFDGAPQYGPYGINDGGWSAGAYLLLYYDFFTAGSSTFWCGTPASGSTSNNNPLSIKYVRIWQAQ